MAKKDKSSGELDIVLPRLKTLIEIRGCFWHHHGWAWDGRKLVQRESCPQATAPKTNRAFWNAKFRSNVRRDQEHEKLSIFCLRIRRPGFVIRRLTCPSTPIRRILEVSS